MSKATNREEVIFEQALGLDSPEAREAHVHQACRDDLVLRERVLGLLRAHARAGVFLHPRQPVDGGSPRRTPDESRTVQEAAATEEPGDGIGRYKRSRELNPRRCGGARQSAATSGSAVAAFSCAPLRF
jgi:hypothetical protein